MVRIARTDRNHQEIMDALRQAGASVFSTHTVGKGFGDLVVGIRNNNYILEVKDGNLPPSKRKLTKDEKEFKKMWRGQYAVVNSIEEAFEAVGL